MESGPKANHLKSTFIAMLFALVVATIAQKTAEISSILTQKWSNTNILATLSENDWGLLSSLTHIFLALFLVSASWVGWSRSESSGHRAEIKSLLSIPFVLLFIEVILVIAYFGLALSIEIPEEYLTASYNQEWFHFNPSGLPESLLITTVFFLWIIWDFLGDVLGSPLDESTRAPFRIVTMITGSITYCSVSAICFLLSGVIYYLNQTVTGPYFAAVSDIALISVICIFYSAKIIEPIIIKIFPWEESRNNSKREIPKNYIPWCKLTLSTGIYLLSIIGFLWLKSKICQG